MTTEATTATDVATPSADTATPTEAPATSPSDEVTGLEVETNDNDLTAPKEDSKTETPEEVKKDEPSDSKDTTDDAKADEAPVSKTMAELGYEGVRSEQVALAGLASDMGVSHDDLRGAIVDGKFDVSKLEGLSARDSQLLKNSMDVELTRLSNEKTERRNELHAHTGGEENFNKMVDYVNQKASTDLAFKAEVTTLRNMMVEGGKPAELAVKSLFDKFKADPNTSLSMSSEGGVTDAGSDDGLTSRQKLDKGWDNLQVQLNK